MILFPRSLIGMTAGSEPVNSGSNPDGGTDEASI